MQHKEHLAKLGGPKSAAEEREAEREEGTEEVMTIASRADSWHSDITWMRHPPKATFLQCVSRDASMDQGGMLGGATLTTGSLLRSFHFRHTIGTFLRQLEALTIPALFGLIFPPS